MSAATDIIVIGAGPAGIRAAITLADAGLRPIVLDEQARAGGQIYRRPPHGFHRSTGTLYGFEARKAESLHRGFDALASRIDYRPNTLAWSIEGGQVRTLSGERTAAIPYAAIVIASGATDRVIPMPGWTLPGVYSLGGAQVALKHQAMAIGRRVAFLGTGPLLYLVAYQYAKAGAEIAAVLDTAPFGAKLRALPTLLAAPSTLAKGLYYLGWLRARGIPIESGITPVAIKGRDGVEGLSWQGRGSARAIECDAVAIGYGLRAETQLADLAGVPFAFDSVQRQALPVHDGDGRTPVPRIYLAGDGAGIRGADAAEAAGELAALALLADCGMAVPGWRQDQLRHRLRRLRRFRAGLERAFPFPADLARAMADETVLCRCETITAGRLRHEATRLAAHELNRAKAFSRVGMGRCQGRMCAPAAAEVLAQALGQSVEAMGRFRAQPPVKPLPLVAALVQHGHAAE